MAVLRPHLALTVTDVGRSVDFYGALFGTKPSKLRPGYAKFELEQPALNLTLNEGRSGGLGAFNHAGIQVESTDDVLRARARLAAAGLAPREEMSTTCCYAEQDKIWVTAPDGERWEVFVTHRDAEAVRGSCSLDAAGLAGQLERYRRIAADVVRVDRRPNRLDAWLAREADARLVREAVEVERGCCPFFEIELDPDEHRLSIGVSDPAHGAALDAIAASLDRLA